MKKKIKNITIGEFDEVCKQQLNCQLCKFNKICNITSRIGWLTNEELEEKIEL